MTAGMDFEKSQRHELITIFLALFRVNWMDRVQSPINPTHRREAEG